MKAEKSKKAKREFTEGPVRKGGSKKIPITPKPDIRPAGQNPSKSAGQIAAGLCRCCGRTLGAVDGQKSKT